MTDLLLSRKEAANYLVSKFGSPAAIKATTLAKLATLGGGPIFRRCGSRVGYRPQDLDEWVAARASPTLRSTSDVGGIAR